MQRTLTIATMLGLLAVFAFAGFANAGRGMGPGYGPGGCGQSGPQAPALTAEQQKKYDAIMDEHSKKVAPLREEMWVKHNVLKAAMESGDTAKTESISKELSALRVKMDAERDALEKKLEAEGLPVMGGGCGGYGRGMGRGMMGHGMMGGGMMGGGMGFGPGDCPGANQ